MSYSYLESQAPKKIFINTPFDIADTDTANIINFTKNGNTDYSSGYVYYANQVEYTVDAYIELLNNWLDCSFSIADDGYITKQRMFELFPKLTPDQKAIRVPVIPLGASKANSPETGLIHYNENSKQFEGYSSGSWQGLGGVINIAQTTKIIATDDNKLEFYTSDSQRMIIDDNGSVGIGTTSPGANLHIKDSDGDAVLKIGSNSEGTDSKILLGTPHSADSAYKTGIIAEAYTEVGWSRAKLHFCLDNTDTSIDANDAPTYDASISNSRMTILPSGEVGIGTTDPKRTLDLSKTGQITFGHDVTTETSAKAGMYWHNNDGYGIYRNDGAWSGDYAQLMIKFSTGIILDPGSGDYGKSHVGVVGGVSIGDTYYTTKSDNNLIVQGSVGIGTTTPTTGYKLDVNGNVKANSFNGSLSGNATSATTATNVAYSGLTGTVPTWNQDTTGNAATATNVAYSGLTGTVPTWNQDTTGNAATATNVAYSGLTGTVPTWNQHTTGNAATATKVNITAQNNNVTRYLTFVGGTGNQDLQRDQDLNYNPSTNVLTASSFSGNLIGNAASATTAAACSGNAASATTAAACSGNAATATQVKINTVNTDATRYIAFANGGGGTNHQMEIDGNLYYNPSDNVLTASLFSGNLRGNAASATTAAACSGNAASATKLNTTINGIVKTISSNGTLSIGELVSGDIPDNSANAGGLSGTPNISVGTINCSTITGTGQCQATSFKSTSDEKMKNNITQLDTNLMLNKITSLKGVSFEFKKNMGETHLGVIAQDVEKQFPELVEEGEHKCVNYDGFVGPFIECFKALQTKTDSLESQNKELMNQNKLLESKIQKIESLLESLTN